jgi:bacterial/archaeal transporter family-2 protein
MGQFILVIFIGLIAGVAVGIQGPIAGSMSQRIGASAGSFIVHLSGLILSGILVILQGGQNVRDWLRLPWYMLGAGVFGVILYQSINITLPRLGATLMVALIIIGQLSVGILVDHFGWFGVSVHPINAGRVIGVIVLLIGGYLIAR